MISNTAREINFPRMRRLASARALCTGFCVLLLGMLPATAADGPELETATTTPLLKKTKPSTSPKEVIQLLERVSRQGDLSAEERIKLLTYINEQRKQQKAKSRTEQEMELIAKFKLLLKRRVADDPDERANREALAMFYLFLDEPEKVLKHLTEAGPASRRDLYYPLLMAYTHLRLGEYDKAARYHQYAGALLNHTSPLRLSTPVFCQSIQGYRRYTPHPTGMPKAGEDVNIYVEISGASFRETTGGGAQCNLRFGLTLCNELQDTLWTDPDHATWRYTYRGAVQEMHLSLRYHVPDNLPSGRYKLLIDCDDLNGKEKKGSTMIVFKVAGMRNVPVPKASKTKKTRDDKKAATDGKSESDSTQDTTADDTEEAEDKKDKASTKKPPLKDPFAPLDTVMPENPEMPKEVDEIPLPKKRQTP